MLNRTLVLALVAASSVSFAQDRGRSWERPSSETSSNTVKPAQSGGHYEGSRAFGRREYIPDESPSSSPAPESAPYQPTALNYSSLNRSVTIQTEDATAITTEQKDRALLQLQQVALARPSYIKHQRAGAFEVLIVLTKDKNTEIDSAGAEGLEIRLGTDSVLNALAIAKAFGGTLVSASIGGDNTLDGVAKAINYIED